MTTLGGRAGEVAEVWRLFGATGAHWNVPRVDQSLSGAQMWRPHWARVWAWV